MFGLKAEAAGGVFHELLAVSRGGGIKISFCYRKSERRPKEPHGTETTGYLSRLSLKTDTGSSLCLGDVPGWVRGDPTVRVSLSV